MEPTEKLSILADAAKYDASCSSSGVRRKSQSGGIGNATGTGICHSYTPDGRCVSLLKILLTNFCIYDCSYCINRISSDVRRARFSVDEVVSLTMNFYKRNYIEGLFLSSGVLKSSDETMEEMILVAKKLRLEERFGGYIHLKAVAGCSPDLLRKAGLYADRLSANIELPTQQDLNLLAPAKTHAEAEAAMGEIRERILESKEEPRRDARSFAPGGQSTQVIIGATAASDREIMLKSSQLYERHDLRRVYYTAYSPIPGSSSQLPAEAPPLVREHRLYQTDWLLRFYGFTVDEVLPEDDPNLHSDQDPKLAWALRNRQFFPVDVNLAPRELLLRVPGFGAKVVAKILSARRHRRIRISDLSFLPTIKKAKFFIVTHDDHRELKHLDRPDLGKKIETAPVQLDLLSALDGEI